jgi:hypothetical protein
MKKNGLRCIDVIKCPKWIGTISLRFYMVMQHAAFNDNKDDDDDGQCLRIFVNKYTQV